MSSRLRPIGLAIALALTLLLPGVALAAQPLAGPPAGWEAHPPFRVHGKPTRGTPTGYSPAQIRRAYGFDALSSTGAGQVIGIVDAYDDPTVASDLATFIKQFGLASMHGLTSSDPCSVSAGPHPCFQKTYAQGKPNPNGGWALEISLDVQWAHAIAPGADILLVEAKTASLSNLLGAVNVAVTGGAQAVSMSWGGSEFSSESSYDASFNRASVTFTAASGDSGAGTIWPAVSPYVVAVGGTTLPLDSSGNRTGAETTWSGSGGGISAYESEPGYQSSYPIPATGGKRGSPDVAYNADPATGFAVYDSTKYQGQSGWFQVGGTSAGSPQWAALIALANPGRSKGSLSSDNLTSSPEYDAATGNAYTSNYNDITLGTNGSCGSTCTAATGYDFVTGLGSPQASNLVPYLTTH